jgi:hypothetical protein
VLGFILLKQNINKILGVFPDYKLDEHPLTDALPFQQKSSNPWISRTKLWHRCCACGGFWLIGVWLISVCMAEGDAFVCVNML